MDFMMEVPDAMSGTNCERIISLFEKRTDLQYAGETSNGVVPDVKQDTEITINQKLFQDKEWQEVLAPLVDSIKSSMELYKEKYSVGKLIGIDSINNWNVEAEANIQRFLPKEGFKKWHCESASKNYSARVLVWMLYLNTVTDRGGTEFYFQDKTLKPEQGKMVLWPPFWTHFHRSEVSPTQTKYIITGWFEFS